MNPFFCCGLCLLLWSSASAMGADVVEVTYDRHQDRITIHAKDVSLSQIFAQLAQKAGIESHIDSAVAGDRLNVDQASRLTSEVLQQMLRGYSYTLTYRSGVRNSKQIAAVTILGAVGKPSAGTSLPPIQYAAGEWRETAGATLAARPADAVAGGVGRTNSVSSSADVPLVAQAPLVSQPVSSAASTVTMQQEAAISPDTVTSSANATAGTAAVAPVTVAAPAGTGRQRGPHGAVIEQ